VARRSARDRAHFLNIAESSLAEVAYILHVARRLSYLADDEYAALEREVQSVFAPLTGLFRATRAESEGRVVVSREGR
jgi:four helix bundle protein